MRNSENYIVMCHKHWSVFIVRSILILILLASSFVGFFGNEKNVPAGIIFLIAAGLIALSGYVSYKSSYLALTENKIIGHQGIIRSKTVSMPISKVQNIHISNGLFGKMLGYHMIAIDNAGTNGTEYIFRKASNAQSFVKAVEARM